MKILGIDTSNLVLSVAVMEEDKLLGEYTTNLKKNHSIRLMPAISLLMEELDVDPTDLTGIAIAHGPGSYTGTRMGVTTAKSMAWSLGIPLVGISSLEAVAGNAPYFPGRVCPMFDARRGQAYASLFENGERVMKDQILLVEPWSEQLASEGTPVLFLGDDVALHRQMIVDKMGTLAVFGPAEWNVPRASYIARIGMEEIKAGRHVEVDTFTPQYLQLAEAESKWLASQGK
ncbi:tRNA (adenosine(37)-N6)-threonylcarbamoyltransferase complex dimerization subunit type 1 TsaB [Ammoniphilus sp. CFH 90114]|uniref:tRNA (adenosine(37)-N6)-threonylcarbamoyltransferase complex dimerization subunit type 1 TsaB n=1 Tax=Ammoniphilus sp. CFH 90114 TaxID=2493665 RepID=UPI00100E9FF7|nr:tRNA (adenosine(37)-N6)-threonylcarbamoyltransferase complex dimerization subunit type 1 TsaB [Ammoniphilus sp. CFH 90114]RXT05195.1 tRNA (adenosine(37)-N6)-threonylcarbamoyltransferase complex dimerization subunit type 1 TsaB [Ammoniphilus sp. CFH 90114]